MGAGTPAPGQYHQPQSSPTSAQTTRPAPAQQRQHRQGTAGTRTAELAQKWRHCFKSMAYLYSTRSGDRARCHQIDNFDFWKTRRRAPAPARHAPAAPPQRNQHQNRAPGGGERHSRRHDSAASAATAQPAPKQHVEPEARPRPAPETARPVRTRHTQHQRSGTELVGEGTSSRRLQRQMRYTLESG